jgi:hypothetical protein
MRWRCRTKRSWAERLRPINALERFPGLRVIFTSGHSRNRNEGTANLAQASYLQKPYNPTKLGKLLRDILHGQEKRAVS